MSHRPVQEPPIEEMFERAFSAFPIGIALCTAGDCPLASATIYVNQAFCSLSGYSADVLVGHSALLLGGARPDAESVRRLCLTGAETDLHVTVTKCRPDGTTYRAQSAILPLRGGEGAVTHFLVLECEVSTARDANVPLNGPHELAREQTWRRAARHVRHGARS